MSIHKSLLLIPLFLLVSFPTSTPHDFIKIKWIFSIELPCDALSLALTLADSRRAWLLFFSLLLNNRNESKTKKKILIKNKTQSLSII